MAGLVEATEHDMSLESDILELAERAHAAAAVMGEIERSATALGSASSASPDDVFKRLGGS
jgi:hypothetical protein